MKNILVGVGTSNLVNSFDAGREAALKTLESHTATPDVLIIFSSMQYNHKELLGGITSVTGKIPMVGGTTAGEISNIGFSTKSVTIMGLSSDKMKFICGIGTEMSKSETSCSKSLIKDLESKTNFKDALSLLIFPNGMGGDGVKIIEGLQNHLGTDFEIVGGYLGDDERFESTFQYYNGKVYKDAMPGLLVCSTDDYRTGVGVRSGFESIGNRFYCSASNGNVVEKFDEESALTMYKDLLGEERAARLPGIALEYPFGLIDEKVSIGDKEYFQLRCGLAVDHSKGTITLAASIPEGSAITLTTASRSDIIKGAELAARQALESLDGAKPKAIMMFSCVGRKLILGRRTNEEVEAVQKVLGNDVPIIGFYTYGEIGPIDKLKKDLKVTKFHNETVVLWVLGE
jgi:hypothetical protein